MSQVKTILKALVKLGVATYDDLEAETNLPRNKLRWSCNALKTDGYAKQVEDALTKEVAFQITPYGRTHLIKIAGESIEAAPAHGAAKPITADMAKTKAKAAKNSKALQATPAAGGANISRSPESESHVVAATTSPEVQAVVEQPVADDSPSPAGSDVKTDFINWAQNKLLELSQDEAEEQFTDPQLFAMLSIDGTLHIEFAGKEVNLPAFAVRQLGDFLDDTQPAWY